MTEPKVASERRRLGAWYTPLAVVDAVVAEAVFPGAQSVVDTACGDGRFLAATGLPEQVGVDIDPATEFIHDDALTREWGDRTFDVLVGNPPFLNPLRRRTGRTDRDPVAGGPYVNTAAEFLALAMRLVRPGGRIGLVLPVSLLSTRDAAAVRAMADDRAALRWMWWSDTKMFDADVQVWAGVWEVGAEQGMVRRSFGPDFRVADPMPMPAAWSGLLTGSSAAPHHGPVLGDIATFTVDFRDQYYGLVGAVSDDVDGPPLVTSGLIDPGVCRWGERPVRFAKQRYAAPRVALERLSAPMQRWAAQRLVPKILIANQTSVIEAVHDPSGAWLPSVPVITCVTAEPDRVMATLSSPATLDWIRHHAAGSGLSSRAVRLSPSLLARIPLGDR